MYFVVCFVSWQSVVFVSCFVLIAVCSVVACLVAVVLLSVIVVFCSIDFVPKKGTGNGRGIRGLTGVCAVSRV